MEHPSTARRNSSSARPSKTRRLAAALLGLAACGTVAALLWQAGQEPGHLAAPGAAPVAVAAAVAPAAGPASAGGTGVRLVYPYSIVPGGVASRAELARIVKQDKVVAVHYADIDFGKAHAVQVGKPRAVHVSYRKGDKVYWTARKVTLAAGETVLTDGKHEIRGRCGNRISDVARLPVAADGPGEDVLDTAMEEPADDAGETARQAGYAPEPAGTGGAQSFRLASFAHGAGLAFANGQPNANAGFGQRLLASGTAPVRSASDIAYGGIHGGGTEGDHASPADAPTSPAGATGPADGSSPDGDTGGGGGGPGGSGPGGITLPTLPDEPIVPPPDGSPGKPVSLPETMLPPTTTPQPPIGGGEPPVKGEVAEPGSLWLCGAAFAAMLARRRPRPRR